MRVIHRLSSFVALAVLAGCADSIPTSRHIGVINLKDTTDLAGGYDLYSNGVFWNASQVSLPNSALAADSCFDQIIVTVDSTRLPYYQHLDAGASIIVGTNKGTGEMTPDTLLGRFVLYRPPTSTLPGHTPNSDVTYTIPGATGGMAPTTFVVHTPAVLILGPIDPQPVDSLHLTWNAGRPDTTAVVIRLIYSPPTLSNTGHEIFCSMVDDGDFWVNTKLSKTWKNSAYQAVTAYRWETTTHVASDDALLVGIAQFDTLKTSLP